MNPYLNLAPILLLLLTALGVLVLQRSSNRYGFTWLAVAAASLITWGIIFYFRWNPPLALQVSGWLSVHAVVGDLIFRFDAISWQYAFALAGVAVAGVLTAGARLQQHSNPLVWAAILAITALGILAVMAVTPLALLLAWGAIDFMELVVMIASVSQRSMNRHAVISFSLRLGGSMMVIVAMLFSQSVGVTLTLESVVPSVALILLVAVGLRLSVLPLYLPFSREVLMRRGLGNTLRMVTAAASLVVLARLPQASISDQWQPLLMALTALALVYAGVMWMMAEDEVRARPYWIILLSGLSVACVIQGYPASSVAWGLALILPGSSLFLYSARQQFLLALPILALVGLTGLPFTPMVTGWAGMQEHPFNLFNLVLLGAAVMMLVGYVRYALRPDKSFSTLDRWVQVVYPVGLMIPLITHWLVVAFGMGATLQMGTWWAGIAVLALAAVGVTFLLLLRRRRVESTAGWLSILFSRLRNPMGAFFRLNWLYSLIRLGYLLAREVVDFFTGILEGQGGVLWVLLLLTLLISLIGAGGAR
jgi:hypothetical protein